jgi:hypothetical protein
MINDEQGASSREGCVIAILNDDDALTMKIDGDCASADDAMTTTYVGCETAGGGGRMMIERGCGCESESDDGTVC